jgi:hypothetical protein
VIKKKNSNAKKKIKMKDLVSKLIKLLLSLKGKKPIVIGIVAAIFIVGFFAVQKGYISQDVLDMDLIIKEVEKAFASDSTKAVVDSLNQTSTMTDTLIK